MPSAFGLGLIAIPVLIYLDLRFVPGPLLVAALTLHMLVLRRDRSHVDSSGLALLLGGRLLGTVPAALLLAWLPLEGMKLLLGFDRAGWRGDGCASHRRAIQRAQCPLRRGHGLGLHGHRRGPGGPPVALIYQNAPGRRLRGTLAAYFIIGTVVSLIALAAVGRFAREEVRLSFFLIPGTVIGYSCLPPSSEIPGRRVHAHRCARGVGAGCGQRDRNCPL